MPSSTAKITRDELIRRSLRRLGVRYPNATQIVEAAALLNDITKELDTEGKWLWAINPAPSTFYTANGQRSYPVGGAYQYAKVANFGNIDLATAFNPDWDTPWTMTFRVRLPTNGVVELQNLAGPQGFTISLDATITTHFLTYGYDDVNIIRITFADATLENAGWMRFTVTYDGSGEAAGFAVYRDGAAYDITVSDDNLAGKTTVSASPMIILGGPAHLTQLGIFSGVELSALQIEALGGLGDRGPLDALTFSELLTNWWPLDGDSIAAIGDVSGTDHLVTYPTEQGNGIAKNVLRMEWAELVTGTSRKPIAILYHREALTNVLRETSGGQPYCCYLETQPDMEDQRLHLFQTPGGVYRIDYTYRRRLSDFSSASDNPDYPQDWAQRLVKRLSLELAPEYRIPLEERQLMAVEVEDAMHKGKATMGESPTPRPERTQYF